MDDIDTEWFSSQTLTLHVFMNDDKNVEEFTYELHSIDWGNFGMTEFLIPQT